MQFHDLLPDTSTNDGGEGAQLRLWQVHHGATQDSQEGLRTHEEVQPPPSKTLHKTRIVRDPEA